MTTPFKGERVLECETCNKPIEPTAAGSLYYRHVNGDADHWTEPKHRCAGCHGKPYYKQEAWGNVVGCHTCDTYTFTSIGD